MTAAAAKAQPTRSAFERSHLRAVEAPRPRHTLVWLLVLIMLVGTAVIGAVALNALAAADAVEARRLEAEVSDAERRHAALVAEVAQLDAPNRIRMVATTELGMIQPGPPRLLVLDRTLPSDQTVTSTVQDDPLKPVLAVEK